MMELCIETFISEPMQWLALVFIELHAKKRGSPSRKPDLWAAKVNFNDREAEAESGQACYLTPALGAKVRACSFAATPNGMLRIYGDECIPLLKFKHSQRR